jgi:allophanate hydrolase
VHPAVRAILEGASDYSAADAFHALHELRALRGRVDALFRDVDLLLLPTVPAIYSVEHVLANPHGPNLRLGLYTSFVNLLDLCALAIPAGSRADGVPFGITLIARRGRDALLASVGRALHPLLSSTAGATSLPLPMPRKPSLSADGRPLLAVVGAHLSGEPLNHELTDLGARLVCATRTAPCYRLHALALTPPKPGLVRVGGDEPGHAIEVEVWQLDQEALGRFMRGVRAPLCIGTLELEDGSEVLGFLCEASATRGQRDISSFAGWRAFRRHSSSSA